MWKIQSWLILNDTKRMSVSVNGEYLCILMYMHRNVWTCFISRINKYMQNKFKLLATKSTINTNNQIHFMYTTVACVCANKNNSFFAKRNPHQVKWIVIIYATKIKIVKRQKINRKSLNISSKYMHILIMYVLFNVLILTVSAINNQQWILFFTLGFI